MKVSIIHWNWKEDTKRCCWLFWNDIYILNHANKYIHIFRVFISYHPGGSMKMKFDHLKIILFFSTPPKFWQYSQGLLSTFELLWIHKNYLHLQSTIYKLHIYTTYLLPWHGLVSPPPPASQAWSGDWTPRCEASRKSSSGSRTSADPGPGTWSASPRSSSTPGPIRGEHGVTWPALHQSQLTWSWAKVGGSCSLLGAILGGAGGCWPGGVYRITQNTNLSYHFIIIIFTVATGLGIFCPCIHGTPAAFWRLWKGCKHWRQALRLKVDQKLTLLSCYCTVIMFLFAPINSNTKNSNQM